MFVAWLVACVGLAPGVQRPWRKQLTLTRGQVTALGWSGVSIALFLFGTMYLSKICGPIRCVLFALWHWKCRGTVGGGLRVRLLEVPSEPPPSSPHPSLCRALVIQHSERVFAAILGVCMGRRLQPGKVGNGVASGELALEFGGGQLPSMPRAAAYKSAQGRQRHRWVCACMCVPACAS